MPKLVDRLVSLQARVRSWLRASLHRRDLDRLMNDELRFHIEAHTDALERRGLSSEEARRRARAEFGSLAASKEECREALGLRLLDELRADLRYAVRLLRRSPAFTAVAVMSLGIGIGANTAIFTLVDKLLLSTIPVEDAWRLVEVNRTGPGGQGPVISYPTYRFLRDHNAVFTDIAVTGRIRRWSVLVPGATEPERVAGELVSANYFSLLGVRPAIGRLLMPDDDGVAGVGGHDGAVAVLNHDFWRRRFAADPAVLGQTLRIGGVPVTVVGVVRSGFSGIEIADSVDVWVPVALQPKLSLGTELARPAWRQLAAGHRSLEARRLARAGERRQQRRVLSAPQRPGATDSIGRCRVWPLDIARPCVVFSRPSHGSGGPGAAHRVCERREPLSGEGQPPPARGDLARRARCESRTPDSPAADGEPALVDRRRSRRAPHRAVDKPRARTLVAAKSTPCRSRWGWMRACSRSHWACRC